MLTSNPPFTDARPEVTRRRPLPINLTSAYHSRELIVPSPGHCFRPSALNEAGLVIGNSVRPRRFEGAAWSATGICFPPLPASPDETISAENAWPFTAVSSNVLIVGTRGTSDNSRRAWASHRAISGKNSGPTRSVFLMTSTPRDPWWAKPSSSQILSWSLAVLSFAKQDVLHSFRPLQTATPMPSPSTIGAPCC